MVQSINTKVDLVTECIVYLGFAKYGKLMIGDNGIEFFSDRNVKDNIILPWESILKIEGEISNNKIRRMFYIVLQNKSKIRISSKKSGQILKICRDKLGNKFVVRAPTFFGTIKKIFKK